MNPAQRLDAWNAARRILCVRLDRMGDVLMATPAIRALKQQHPQRHITLLTSAGGAMVAPFIDVVDETIVHAAPWVKESESVDVPSDLKAIDMLRSGAFDAAVILTSYSQSPLPAALHCYLAGIPLRAAHCRENPYGLLTDWIAESEPDKIIRHEVQRQLDLVRSVGSTTGNEQLALQTRPDDVDTARYHLQQCGIDLTRKWLLLHPGASAASRRYPAPLWAQVIRQLTAQGFQVVLSGSADEQSALDQIRSLAEGAMVRMSGEVDLGIFAAMISLAPLLISNNTGPVHIAAAVGTSVVDLYALTNPQHTPWRVPCRVLYEAVPCAFCYKSICPQQHQHCLTKVSPQRVVDAALELFDARSFS